MQQIARAKAPKVNECPMQQIARANGTLTTDIEKINQLETEAYKRLLGLEDIATPDAELLNSVLSCMKAKVPKATREQLATPVQREEIEDSLRKISGTSCPGSDNAPKAWYMEFGA